MFRVIRKTLSSIICAPEKGQIFQNAFLTLKTRPCMNRGWESISGPEQGKVPRIELGLPKKVTQNLGIS